ncbi:hypothetical protein LSAT2_027167 [Lamellibrachia satsuma]|nr:hypothetical protein LSAT2_027167 [Lamellibrachia satsuma]
MDVIAVLARTMEHADGVNGYSCTCTIDIYTGTHCEELIRRRLYQYGVAHDDKRLRDDVDKSCDRSGKACSSGFIKTPLIQVFDSQFKTIKVMNILI